MNTIPSTLRRIKLGLCLVVVLIGVQGCGSADNASDKAANATPSAPPISRPSDNTSAPPEVVAGPKSDDTTPAVPTEPIGRPVTDHAARQDKSSLLFVFMLATFIGLGVILRVSRLLHTPLMSLTNAISAIAVVGSIIVTGSEGYPPAIRFLGGVALFASMTNIVSGFLITDRMLKMFKSPGQGGKR
jgi:H+-translocating NAD(P) transhydrogenase subunit alpha